jgi:hypothetical protein
LPTLRNEIEAKLSTVQEDLDSLPASFAENPQGQLLNLCAEFNARIRECTIGSESYPSFFEGLYEEFERLSDGIAATRPNFEVPQKKVQKETSGIFIPPRPDYVIAPVPVSLSCPSTPVISESEVIGEFETKREKRPQGQLFLHEVTDS